MIVDLIWAGLSALKEYIALHVLMCLIPAFLLAGGMVSFIRLRNIGRFIEDWLPPSLQPEADPNTIVFSFGGQVGGFPPSQKTIPLVSCSRNASHFM